ncbi:hypothetical protein MIT9_P2178 [Methylomarinovum caldicuralii]|uniref:Uncharacterized protein n=1 Tax=Methylomarinovum caldicuralii TaxID=438856 RepID=A0AAU9C2H2_9GAMM|nr:hypothetical protein MIT9_P2178 [Methylomarinovum caldicuralii]
MRNMKIPEEIIHLLEAHLEPKEAVRAINALNDLLFNLESRFQAQQLRFMEELKVWLSTELATKSEVASIEVRIREDISALKERMSAIEEKMAATATREDLARIEGRMESLAAKDALTKVESSLREDLARIEGRMESLATKDALTKAESSLREDLAKVESSLRKDLAKVESSLREDLARIEGRMESLATKEELAKLNTRMIVGFLILLFTIIFLNQNALEFIARLVGLVK